MIIRKMSILDFESVNKLMGQVHTIHVQNRSDCYVDIEFPYPIQEFSNMVEDTSIITILAEEEKNVVGICVVSIREKSCMVNLKTAYMDNLCVDENCRNKGIGAELFKFAEKEAKKMGAKRLDLMVWEFNEKANIFYQRLGMNIQRSILEKNL